MDHFLKPNSLLDFASWQPLVNNHKTTLSTGLNGKHNHYCQPLSASLCWNVIKQTGMGANYIQKMATPSTGFNELYVQFC
jgi:hypothetical protein